MSLTKEQRTRIIEAVKRLVVEKHVNVANPRQNYESWAELVDAESPRIVEQADVEAFESGVRGLLTALGSSHTAFFRGDGNDVPPPHSIHASLKRVDTNRGPRWMFWDVIEEGVADRAEIRRGELLLGVDSVELIPPQTARFRIGGVHHLTLGNYGGGAHRTVTVEIPNRPAKGRPPMVEPKSVSHRMLEPGLGYVRVASFPGAIGQQFARRLDAAIADLKKSGCDRLMIDLRGNVGGGLGSLRLMSYLCPGKVPVGYSVTRDRLRNGYRKEELPRIDRIPSSKLGLLGMAFRFRFVNRDRSLALFTEGLGPQPFHGRIAILQNEFSHSAAEMVLSFAAENQLATLVGTRSAGEVLGGANFSLPADYRLRIPIAGWFTWSFRSIEGIGVESHVAAHPDPEVMVDGKDIQIEAARGGLMKSPA